MRYIEKRISELELKQGDVWINGNYVQEVQQMFFDPKTNEEVWINVNLIIK